MIFDFHTHCPPADSSVVAMVNLSLPLDDSIAVSRNLRFSVGIHPWQLVDLSSLKIDSMMKQLDQVVASWQVDAIGECGLDRTINVSLEEQIIVLGHQVKLAKKYHLPLIIHCVRTYSELITVAKTYSPCRSWIIHGFNGNTQQLEQLLKHDIFYFSFGPALLEQPDKFIPLLRMVPKSHLLLETDDSDTTIMDIYRQAAKLCGCSYQAIAEQMEKNWITLFK
ncbi:MAG: TatD family hydrolase [Victivallaceae bacterium]|nr:TatD family hydrolase [Victivallaceae bacterium]